MRYAGIHRLGFWGNSVILLKDQGVNVLLNLFCGPVVNAAQGIAMQINAAVYSFVSNFMIAIRPQIIKNHASGNFQAMHIQIIKSGKFGFHNAAHPAAALR